MKVTRHSPGWGRLAVAIASLAAVTGCAARGAQFSSRFVKAGEPTVAFDAPGAARQQAEVEDLADWGRKLRTLQANARTKSSMLPSIESQNPMLSSALRRLAVEETAENHRRVAAVYRSVGINDYAFRHYRRALVIEPCDSGAFEGIARLWRDWGRPDLALGDVYRAIHCRPQSVSAHNTLGTVLLALGQPANAREAFEFTLMLDARAVFALNNLCYLSLQEGNGGAAQQSCERALALDPTMTAAKTNLALAYALQGNIPVAERRLLDHRIRAVGHYNVGILRMALGRYTDAVTSFETALTVGRAMPDAARRAAQARALAEETEREH